MLKKNKLMILVIVAILAITVPSAIVTLRANKAETSARIVEMESSAESVDQIDSNNSTDGPKITSEQSGLPTSSCSAMTDPTTEGPYFVTDTKELVDGELNFDNLSGDKIRIVGYVFDGSDKSKPLANAKVEIWQADSDGRYWPQSNGSTSRYSEEQISLRGFVRTDAKGFYSYTTIYPGEYEGRARHIHTKATAENKNGVTTQLITSKPGDQTPISQDSIAKSLHTCHTTTFTTIQDIPTAAFDFHI